MQRLSTSPSEPGLPLNVLPSVVNPSGAAVLYATFALGFSCILTQLALMREMLGVFAGNELVIGIALGNWLLLMGIGASLGRGVRKPSPGVLSALLMGTAVFPPIQILALRALRGLLFRPGEAIGMLPSLSVTFALLLPYCVASGFFLTLACTVLPGEQRARAAGKIYAFDSIGSVVGGAAFALVLVARLDHATLLIIPGLLNLTAAAWLAWKMPSDHRRVGIVLAGAAVVLGTGMLLWPFARDPDMASTRTQFPGQHVLIKSNSPYGRIIITEASGQTNVIENGVVLVSTPNTEQAEEIAHLAMLQRPTAKHVLLIGGALSGGPREILRYKVSTLDCVELDPLVPRLGRQLFPTELSEPRLKIHQVDARQFVRTSKSVYDVIIVALPDPSTAQINRFFTHEFFQEVRGVLARDGILSFGLARYENFAGPELSSVLSCARKTVLRSFKRVVLLPAGRVFFVASDGPVQTQLNSALTASGVTPRWVTANYLAGMFTNDRLRDVESAAGAAAGVNHDFAPILYYFDLQHWASQFDSTPRWLTGAALLAAAAYILRLRGPDAVIFASGFAGSAVEVLLLLGIQTLAGSVYRNIAWLVSIFMAGLAAGGWMGIKQIERDWPIPGHGRGERTRRTLALLAIFIAAIAVLTWVALPALAQVAALPAGETATQTIILLLAFCLAVIVGIQFPLANALKQDSNNPAARLYTADFLGASVGALLTSAWLLPLVGIAGVTAIVCGLNLLAAGTVVVRKRALA